MLFIRDTEAQKSSIQDFFNELQFNTKAEFLNSPCGSGKNHAVLNEILANQYNKKYVYIARTIDLLEETAHRASEIGIKNIQIIHSENTDDVKRDILEAITLINQVESGLLLITLAAWDKIKLENLVNEKEWTKIFDELFDVDMMLQKVLHNHNHLIEDNIEIVREFDEDLSLVQLKKDSIYNNDIEELDYVDEYLQDLVTSLKDNRYLVLIQTSAFHRLTSENVILPAKFNTADTKNFNFLVLKLPSSIGSNSIILSATFDSSMLLALFDRLGVKFKQSKIQDKIERKTHENGHLLTIYPMMVDESSKYRLKQDKDDVLVLQEIINRINKHNNNQSLLYTLNKEFIDNHKFKLKINRSWNLLPSVVNGLNCWSEHNKMAILSSVNRNNVHYKMLSSMGFDSEYVSRSLKNEFVYQVAGRLGIARNSLYDKPTMIYVLSLSDAEYLLEKFPGATIDTSLMIESFKVDTNKKKGDGGRKNKGKKRDESSNLKTSMTMTGRRRGSYKKKLVRL